MPFEYTNLLRQLYFYITVRGLQTGKKNENLIEKNKEMKVTINYFNINTSL